MNGKFHPISVRLPLGLRDFAEQYQRDRELTTLSAALVAILRAGKEKIEDQARIAMD
jgi:hypothetical protein